MWLKKWDLFRQQKQTYVEFCTEIVYKRHFVKAWLTERIKLKMLNLIALKFNTKQFTAKRFISSIIIRNKIKHRFIASYKKKMGPNIDTRITKLMRSQLNFNTMLIADHKEQKAKELMTEFLMPLKEQYAFKL